jgi:hypothetical protein
MTATIYCFECNGYVDETHPSACTPEHAIYNERQRIQRRIAKRQEKRARPTPTVKATYSIPAAWAQWADLVDNSAEREAYQRGRRAV